MSNDLLLAFQKYEVLYPYGDWPELRILLKQCLIEINEFKTPCEVRLCGGEIGRG